METGAKIAIVIMIMVVVVAVSLADMQLGYMEDLTALQHSGGYDKLYRAL
jgi:uncharacterized protein YdeI (BOF family)